MKRRAIFLDRDGTLVRAVYRPTWEKKITAPFLMNELIFEPYVGEAMRIFKNFGYLTIIITNQPDVAYGYVTKRVWSKIHNTILNEVKPYYWYMCEHRKEDECLNRKPSPEMLRWAGRDHDINLTRSFMIGDTENDMLAGKAAGCKTILIRRFYNEKSAEANNNADYIVKSLLEAAAIV